MKAEIKKLSDQAHEALCRSDFQKALNYYYQILTIDSNDNHSLHFIAFILNLQGKYKTALDMIKKAIDRYSCDATYYSTLAGIQKNLGNYKEAVDSIRIACELKPNDSVIIGNAAMILADERKYDKACELYELALEFDPDNAFIHFNYSLLLLSMGNFNKGWQEYEWRIPFYYNADKPIYPTDLKNKKVKIIPEQGYGDFIMFSRYFKLLEEAGAEVYINCPKALEPLYQCRYCSDPDFSIHVMSLASLFDTIPATPYLKAPGVLKVSGHNKIGIASRAVKPFSSNAQVKIKNDGSLEIISHPSNLAYLSTFKRSLPQDFFDPLSEKNLYNLQRDVTIYGMNNPSIDDFGQLADWVDQMDLIITIDTALAHLAGALGKETWLLLPYDFEWRWQADRTDSPWYPTMKIFRQPKRGDWSSVQDDICNQLT